MTNTVKTLIINDRRTEAHDNGYALFKYIRKNYPDYPCYYVLKKTSPYFKEVLQYGNILIFNSREYKKLARTNGTLFVGSYLLTDKERQYNKNFVWLQHGTCLTDCLNRDINQSSNIFTVCSAIPEYNYYKTKITDINKLKLLGLCRWDNLPKIHQASKTIFFFPTWRRYNTPFLSRNIRDLDIDKINAYFKKFKNTKQYKTIQSLLNSKQLSKLLEEYGYKLYFMPHKELNFFFSCFSTDSKNIILENHNKNIIKHIHNCDLCITDYSSLALDIAKQKKPILYYMFGKDDYSQHQQPNPHFNYETMGLGAIAYNEEDCLYEIEKLLKNNCKIEEKYLIRGNNFFINSDSYCQDTFDEIQKIRLTKAPIFLFKEFKRMLTRIKKSIKKRLILIVKIKDKL